MVESRRTADLSAANPGRVASDSTFSNILLQGSHGSQALSHAANYRYHILEIDMYMHLQRLTESISSHTGIWSIRKQLCDSRHWDQFIQAQDTTSRDLCSA
jgi:hypothetical protein